MSSRDIKGDDDRGPGNLFKIIDGIVFEMNRTKRMFMIMIISILIIPPVFLFVSSVILVPPFEREQRPAGHLQGDGGAGEFFIRLFSLRNLPLIISLVWLGVGIRQWIVLSDWTKRYERYRRRQAEIEKELDKGNNNNNSADSSV